MYGYVSERLSSSRISASHRTVDFAWCASGSTRIRPRYPVRPPSFETDFELITLVVYGAAWIALPPASVCIPRPAYATLSTSPRALLPCRLNDGYFIVPCVQML